MTDVSEYVLKDWHFSDVPASACLYHAPCHDSLKDRGTALLKNQGLAVTPVPHCCSQAGTMALSRPDISHNMLVRKQEALVFQDRFNRSTPIKILTNCPSCSPGPGAAERGQTGSSGGRTGHGMGGPSGKKSRCTSGPLPWKW